MEVTLTIHGSCGMQQTSIIDKKNATGRLQETSQWRGNSWEMDEDAKKDTGSNAGEQLGPNELTGTDEDSDSISTHMQKVGYVWLNVPRKKS